MDGPHPRPPLSARNGSARLAPGATASGKATPPGEGMRVGVVAPVGRDASLVAERLEAAGLAPEVYPGLDALCEAFEAGRLGVLLLTR